MFFAIKAEFSFFGKNLPGPSKKPPQNSLITYQLFYDYWWAEDLIHILLHFTFPYHFIISKIFECLEDWDKFRNDIRKILG